MPVIMVEGRQKQVEKGTTFEGLAKEYQERYPEKITLVVFNSKMQELSKRVEKDGVLTFLTVKDDSGHKTYCRTAQMMLVKAVRDILGNEAKVNIEFLLGNGYYCFVRGTDAPIDDALAAKVEARMREMQQQDLPPDGKTVQKVAVAGGLGADHVEQEQHEAEFHDHQQPLEQIADPHFPGMGIDGGLDGVGRDFLALQQLFIVQTKLVQGGLHQAAGNGGEDQCEQHQQQGADQHCFQVLQDGFLSLSFQSGTVHGRRPPIRVFVFSPQSIPATG